ncbi:MAG: DPP IV N-terminal domain-containing protein [Candidatus Kryptoniota bacterium]
MTGLYFKFVILFIILTFGAASAQEEFIHPELNWRTIETEHFYVDYHQGEERTAQTVAKIAEEIYGPVTSLYHHRPSQKVSLVLWDTDDYANGATYFYDNKIDIWASSLDFALRGTHNWLRNVITHEFTHDVQMQTAMKFGRRFPAIYVQWLGYESERRPDVLYGYPNVVVSYPVSGIVIPAWFAEGVAQYNVPGLDYDTWDTHRDMILRMYVLDNHMLTLDEMGGFGKTSLGNESTYNAGFAFVHYIAGKYGPDVLLKLSEAMRSVGAFNINYAFEKVLGISAMRVYDDWKAFLEENYRTKIGSIKENLVEGDIIEKRGFANLFPQFSPDGKYIAYCSNKSNDYFSTSSIYLYGTSDSSEKELVKGVSSELSWTPDGKYIVYSKQTRFNPFWYSLYDIYAYNMEKGKEIRLTRAMRANYPSLSSDGKKVAFVIEKDGTGNLYEADVDFNQSRLLNVRKLTDFRNGEQVYTPHWSSDGSMIIFVYSITDSRRLAIYTLKDSSYRFITPDGEDSRDPVFVNHDSDVVFSSDRSGIFNLYRIDLATGNIVPLTDVLGGAFMPSVSADGRIAYSSYHWNGYKLAYLRECQPIKDIPRYIVSIYPVNLASTGGEYFPSAIKHFDDMNVQSYKSKPYESVTTSMSFYPVLLYDNYNPHTSFFDELKAGLYFYSTDVVGKYDIFGGATLNKLLERDLFLQLNYNDKLPGLSSLGIYPKFTMSAYNLSRQTQGKIGLGADTIQVPVTYNLIEVSTAFSGPIVIPSLNLSLGFTFDRYNSTIGGFTLPELGAYIPSSGDVYYLGRTFYFQLGLDEIKPSRNSSINPLGIRTRLTLSGDLDKLNADGNYQYVDGMLVPIYQKFNFIRTELVNYTAMPLFKDDDAVSLKLHFGYTFGPTINSFFDFYGGGLIGMKGYPFYSISGNRILTVNLMYRFPLFRDINKQILQFYLSDLYLALYSDIGNGWNGDINGLKLRKDAGAQLRLSGFSFYSFPTAIFFDAAYGFDKFTHDVPQFKTVATYGKEWRFYFGMTFDFSILDF